MTPAGEHRPRDDRGQVLSSLVAVAAVVAIVAGLLVLFGTRGSDSAAEPPPKKSTPTVTMRATSPAPSTPPTPAVTPVPTVPPEQRPAVEVYNNTQRKGLADQVANKARTAGWKVTGADNWKGKVVTSTVYFPAGLQVEAQALANELGILRIKDVLPNMKDDRLTVILTTDYPA